MMPLKIVHCANFSESKLGSVFYAIDRKVTNGLIRNGHFVYDFSYRDIAKQQRRMNLKRTGIGKMNQCLVEACQNIQPHILLLGHSELINNATLLKIRANHPDIKIAMWWVDWIYNLKKITERLSLIDSFFITTNPKALREVIDDNSILEKCHYLPNMCDLSIDCYKSFENRNHQYDILFMGRYDEEREQLVQFLKTNFSHLRLGLFGQDEESVVLGTTFFEKIYASKIGINFNRSNEISMYSSDRIIQLTANGVMVLSAEIPDMDSVFSSDEIAYFDTFETLKEKVTYYLEHEEKRKAMAQSGWRRAHADYDCTAVTRNMVQKCFETFPRTPSTPITPSPLITTLKDDNDTQLAQNAFAMVSHYGSAWLFKPNTGSYEAKQPQGHLTRLHGGNRADVYRFTHGDKAYCLKWFHDTRVISKVRNSLGLDKAQLSYRIGEELQRRNVNAPRVLGIVQGNRFAPPLLIMEMLEGYQQMNLMLEEWKRVTPDLKEQPRFVALATEFAHFCLKLTENKVLHHDFSPRNVLISETNNTFTFCLVDLEDVSFGQKFSRTLNHFNERLPRYLSKTECTVFTEQFQQTFTAHRP